MPVESGLPWIIVIVGIIGLTTTGFLLTIQTKNTLIVVKMVLAAALTGMLSGCMVFFTNPLPASQPIGLDQRLLGKWEGKDEQANSGWIRFEMSANQMNVFVSGDLASQNPAFRAVTTNIAGRTYMILRIPHQDLEKYYTVASYSINGNKLMVCPMDEGKVGTAIKDHKIKGQISTSSSTITSPGSGATITESSKNVFRLLNSPGSKDLFTCLTEFTKVTSK